MSNIDRQATTIGALLDKMRVQKGRGSKTPALRPFALVGAALPLPFYPVTLSDTRPGYAEYTAMPIRLDKRLPLPQRQPCYGRLSA